MEKEWVKRALEYSGLTQAELSRKLCEQYNLPDDRSIINKMIKGKRRVKMAEMVQIAKITGFSLPDHIFGVQPLMVTRHRFSDPLASSFDPDETANDPDPDWEEPGAAVIDGRLNFNRTLAGGQPEVAAKPGLGLGQTDGRSARVVSNGIVTGHPVTNEWVVPPSYVRHVLDAQPTEIVIMPVIGHSMAPLLQSNDRVLVDISQNMWVGDAVYVIDDGDGVFQAKTIKKILSSHPPKFRIISEATPDEEPVIRNYDEFRIVGRVVGRFTKM